MPTTPTTARADLSGTLVTVLTAQQTATPTQLRKVYAARPGSFPETPAAYIESLGETITYTAGIRTRTFRPVVVVADTYNDPQEGGDRMDLLVDLLVDRFTDAYAAIGGGNSILTLDSVTDSEIDIGGANGPVLYRTVVLAFGSTFVSEGRT